MTTYGFVFARVGSKGVPGKNIRDLCGKPLITYAIEAGLATGRIDRMIVSTDSEVIAEVARRAGAEVPFLRPPELAGDHSPEWLAWRHAVSFLRERGDKFDVFISLPAPTPLRTSADVIRCLDAFDKGDCDVIITCSPAASSPYFNMIRLDNDGCAHIAVQPPEVLVRRQDAPPVYDIAAVAYVLSPDFIMTRKNLWDGKVKAVTIARENAVDIDDPLDFEIAEVLMRKRLNVNMQ